MARTTMGRAAGVFPDRGLDQQADLQTDVALSGVAQGTLVLTLDGALPVEYLAAGDRVITRGGARPLTAVVSRQVTGKMIRVAPGALGHDRPERALILGGRAEVLLRDWRAQALYGQSQALVPVARLLDGGYITPCAGRMRLFALQFAAAEVIYADGVEVGCTAAQVAA
ncbi:MAG: Hint domain-containing protein [Paracoccaceae bacterium]|nr:Hint domain-containing protein [Paracoccaceae bacterium]